ncbi:hypothetical protein ACIHCX_07445 [Streptomyces sp. NPDC052043]|uniref:hypothetical protein n=1 Tax=Streptomyces sp. NPDC052043 TaxID=3365684 RepID=UPI0037CD0CEE
MRHLSTDIHGGIEFRHPDVGADYYDGEPWVAAMDLWPLCDETDDAAFGFLFGLNNYAGFQPLAPERGLPLDPGLQQATCTAPLGQLGGTRFHGSCDQELCRTRSWPVLQP